MPGRRTAKPVWRFGARLHTESTWRSGTCHTLEGAKCPTFNAADSAPQLRPHITSRHCLLASKPSGTACPVTLVSHSACRFPHFSTIAPGARR